MNIIVLYYPMEKNEVTLFIDAIKIKEKLRFDKDVADLIGVDKHSLANAKLREKLPSSYIIWYCSRYNVSKKVFHKDITSMDRGENLSNPEYAEKRSLEIEVEDLRMDKMNLMEDKNQLQDEIIRLQDKIIKLTEDK